MISLTRFQPNNFINKLKFDIDYPHPKCFKSSCAHTVNMQWISEKDSVTSKDDYHSNIRKDKPGKRTGML